MGAPKNLTGRPEMPASCGTCTFFDLIHTPDSVSVYGEGDKSETSRPVGMVYGICRRFPPVPSERVNRMQHDLVEIMGRWPLVPDDVWCGEWKEELA